MCKNEIVSESSLRIVVNDFNNKHIYNIDIHFQKQKFIKLCL